MNGLRAYNNIRMVLERLSVLTELIEFNELIMLWFGVWFGWIK